MAEIRPHSNPKYREYGVLTAKTGSGRWRADLYHIGRSEKLGSFEGNSEKEARRLAERAAERR